MARIFLSHSSRNNAQAIALHDWLTAKGWGWDDVFLDLDTTSGIAPGERWQKALNDAAGRCEAVVFLSRELSSLKMSRFLGSTWYSVSLRLKKAEFCRYRVNTSVQGLLDGVVKGNFQNTIRMSQSSLHTGPRSESQPFNGTARCSCLFHIPIRTSSSLSR
jgi:hypothetical protein